MKKVMILTLILVSLGVYAQGGERPNKREMAKNLSAEEIATLQSKKMTLALVLDESQAKKIYPLVLEQVKERKAMRETQKTQKEKNKLTHKQRYDSANERLDKRIAMQTQMKQILTEEQFEKFIKHQRRSKRKNKDGRGRKHDSRSKE